MNGISTKQDNKNSEQTYIEPEETGSKAFMLYRYIDGPRSNAALIPRLIPIQKVANECKCACNNVDKYQRRIHPDTFNKTSNIG